MCRTGKHAAWIACWMSIPAILAGALAAAEPAASESHIPVLGGVGVNHTPVAATAAVPCYGVCQCVPNVRCFGCFPTLWRVWPCEPAPPAPVHAIPTPVPAAPKPMPVAPEPVPAAPEPMPVAPEPAPSLPPEPQAVPQAPEDHDAIGPTASLPSLLAPQSDTSPPPPPASGPSPRPNPLRAQAASGNPLRTQAPIDEVSQTTCEIITPAGMSLADGSADKVEAFLNALYADLNSPGTIEPCVLFGSWPAWETR